jgi:hypothetical protein
MAKDGERLVALLDIERVASTGSELESAATAG